MIIFLFFVFFVLFLCIIIANNRHFIRELQSEIRCVRSDRKELGYAHHYLKQDFQLLCEHLHINISDVYPKRKVFVSKLDKEIAEYKEKQGG